jgi:hypothetical protein
MGLNTLSTAQVKFLQWLIGILLVVLTTTGAWSMREIYKLKSDLPEKYVLLERYTVDQNRVGNSLDRIDAKLDRLIERSK